MQAQQTKHKKILVALSDARLAHSIVNRLADRGYTCHSIHNGNDVIDGMKEIKPDLLIIDIKLPGKSGYEVLSEKSFDREITKIPVIIVSNSGEPVRMKEIPATPMIKDYMIGLHIDREDLMKKVDKALNI